MRAKEAGPSSGKQESPASSSCTHSRMVEDEQTPDGKNPVAWSAWNVAPCSLLRLYRIPRRTSIGFSRSRAYLIDSMAGWVGRGTRPFHSQSFPRPQVARMIGFPPQCVPCSIGSLSLSP